MTQGYYSGISGLQTHQYGLDVVSDNLANVNTIGFRGSNTEFAALFTEKLVSAGGSTPTSNEIGFGSRLQATSMSRLNGSILLTDRFNDLSIEGNGWFGVVSGKDTYYTRAGNFVFDEYEKTPGDINSSCARLTTTEGMYVTGTMLNNMTYDAANDYEKALATNSSAIKQLGAFVIDPATNVSLAAIDTQGPLELPTRLAYPVSPTTIANFAGNLGFTPGARTVDVVVPNSLNEQNNLNLVFVKSAIQPSIGTSWDVAATLKSADKLTTYDVQRGQVIFSDSGTLLSSTLPTLDNNGTALTVDASNYFTNANNLGLTEDIRTMSADVISQKNERNRLKLVFTQSASQPLTGVRWDITATVTSLDGKTLYDTQLGEALFEPSGVLISSSLPAINNDGSPVTVDLANYLGGIRSTFGAPISASSTSDGNMGGTLNKYGIGSDGTIIADFSNGRQSAIGRIALYHFQNEQGLEREGSTLYRESSNSGRPTFWTDANGNTITGAKLHSGQLENSNVRLDVGLTDMIIMQRAYQANAKTITTVDEMIQKALSMKR